MAKESKRKSTRTKSVRKKAPARRSKRSKKKGTFKKDLSIFGSVLLMIGMVVLGYQIGKSEAFETPKESSSTNPTQMFYKSESDNKALYKSLEKIKEQRARKEKEERERKARLKQEIEKERLALRKKAELEAKRAKELNKSQRAVYPTEIVKYEEAITLSQGKKPKLAIIIDDVSSKAQLKSLQSLGLKLTPSIFPPHEGSPHNHELAKGLSHYMIHLPMQSGKSYDTHEKTLMVTDSSEQITKRVKEIRALFPHAKYVNNHTGSVFTSTYLSMERLYTALRKEGFIFMDSRTIASTKVPQITKKYADPYLARDVFIDNQHNITSIHKQLKHAVNMAKKRGYAIAIGHPHQVTIQALASAGKILKEVEMVYIDELYRLRGK